MIVIKRLGIFLFLLAAVIVLFTIFKTLSIVNNNILLKLSSAIAVLEIIILAASLLLAWLEYIHYSISVNDGDVKIKKGLISETEFGFPYRKIKEVRLTRSLIDQIFGVSKVIVSVSGEESSGPLVIIMPFLKKEIASLVRDEILQRTQVEDINISPAISIRSATGHMDS